MKPADHVTPPSIDTLMRKVADLEREVQQMRAERRLSASSIEAGSLQINGGELLLWPGSKLIANYNSGAEAFRVGANELSDGTPVHATVIRRPTGRLAFWTYGADTGISDGFWALYDLAENVIFSDDVESGQGIARPWLPINFAPSDYTVWPGTNQATFTSIWETAISRQQPKIVVTLLATTDVSGTTGEVRLTCNGTQLGSTISVAFLQAYHDIGPIALPAGNFGDEIDLKVEARVTAGTGLVRASVTKAYTRQS